jgi:osmotically-inducible protein OsmY
VTGTSTRADAHARNRADGAGPTLTTARMTATSPGEGSETIKPVTRRGRVPETGVRRRSVRAPDNTGAPAATRIIDVSATSVIQPATVGADRPATGAMSWARIGGVPATAPATTSRERGYGGGYGAAGNYGRTGSSSFGRGSREEHDDRGFFERAGDEIRSWFGDDDRQGGAQHHRGRGPRNYTRSDDRIRDDVNDRLTDDPHIDASDIEVTVSSREVTLSGHVGSRFEKRHAEDIADSVSGVSHVQNNLRVRQQNALAGMGGSSSTMTADMGAGSSTGTGQSAGTTGASTEANQAGTSGRRSGRTADT